MGSSTKDLEIPSLAGGPLTVVLMGRTGNGKSATANTILGKKAFETLACSSVSRNTTQSHSNFLKDGRLLNVIDTPGLFHLSVGSELIAREIVRSIDLAKDGFHAVLVVFSVRNRFTREEEAVLQSLQMLFGPKLNDYMILVFTGGDKLDENGESIEDYFGPNCPEPLQETFQACKNRVVLFDNVTSDEEKKASQLQKLLAHVDTVVNQNGGKAYVEGLFAESRLFVALKEVAMGIEIEGEEQSIAEPKEEKYRKSYGDQLKQMTDKVESMLRETTARVEQQLRADEAAYGRSVVETTAHVESNPVVEAMGEAVKRMEQQLVESRAERTRVMEKAEAAQKAQNDQIMKLMEFFEGNKKAHNEEKKKNWLLKCPIM